MGFGGGAVSGVALSFGTSMFEFGKIKQRTAINSLISRSFDSEADSDLVYIYHRTRVFNISATEYTLRTNGGDTNV